jgi:hypothetical protein
VLKTKLLYTWWSRHTKQLAHLIFDTPHHVSKEPVDLFDQSYLQTSYRLWIIIQRLTKVCIALFCGYAGMWLGFEPRFCAAYIDTANNYDFAFNCKSWNVEWSGTDCIQHSYTGLLLSATLLICYNDWINFGINKFMNKTITFGKCAESPMTDW